MTQVFTDMVDDELVQGRVRGTVEVDEMGNTLTFETVSVWRFQDGLIDYTNEGTLTIGVRLGAGRCSRSMS